MNLINTLIFLNKRILEIVFPPCCLICGKLNQNIWCEECKKQILSELNCKIELKTDRETYFSKHIYFFLYKNKIRELILNYKFNDKSYLSEIFSEIIIKNKKICGILKKYDIIIPVPIHKKRKKQRGYNQSELIAKQVAKKLDKLKLENKIIEKTKNNIAQSSLNRQQREENVQNVYKIANKDKIKGKKIIIFDDIYTTGNTVNAISKILKENGAKEIIILTIAKD